MDLKQKFEAAKAKLKEHAPAIASVSSVVAVAATAAVTIMYSDQKKNLEALRLADRWISDHRKDGICTLSEEDQNRLKEGNTMFFGYGETDHKYCLKHCTESHYVGDTHN